MQLPLEQQPGTQIVPFLTAKMLLSHSQLHLLLCPWQSTVHRVLRALAGRPNAIYKSGAILASTLLRMSMPSSAAPFVVMGAGKPVSWVSCQHFMIAVGTM